MFCTQSLALQVHGCSKAVLPSTSTINELMALRNVESATLWLEPKRPQMSSDRMLDWERPCTTGLHRNYLNGKNVCMGYYSQSPELTFGAICCVGARPKVPGARRGPKGPDIGQKPGAGFIILSSLRSAQLETDLGTSCHKDRPARALLKIL